MIKVSYTKDLPLVEIKSARTESSWMMPGRANYSHKSPFSAFKFLRFWDQNLRFRVVVITSGKAFVLKLESVSLCVCTHAYVCERDGETDNVDYLLRKYWPKTYYVFGSG